MARVPSQQFSLALRETDRTESMHSVVVSTFQTMDTPSSIPSYHETGEKEQAYMFTILLTPFFYEVKWSPGTPQ